MRQPTDEAIARVAAARRKFDAVNGERAEILFGGRGDLDAATRRTQDAQADLDAAYRAATEPARGDGDNWRRLEQAHVGREELPSSAENRLAENRAAAGRSA